MSDRDEFEEAAARRGYNLTMAEHETGGYLYPVTQDAWLMWQEAQEQATPQADGWDHSEPPKDGSEFMAYDPDVVDPDFCPDGVVLAMYAEQVMQVAPDRFNDAFIGSVWNDGKDEWTAQVINPVCWMRKPQPPAQGGEVDE